MVVKPGGYSNALSLFIANDVNCLTSRMSTIFILLLQVGSHAAHAGKPRSVSMRQPPTSSNRRGSDYTGHIPPSLLKRHNPEVVVENGTDENPSLVHKGLAQNPNRAEMPNNSSSKRKGSYDYTSVSRVHCNHYKLIVTANSTIHCNTS